MDVKNSIKKLACVPDSRKINYVTFSYGIWNTGYRNVGNMLAWKLWHLMSDPGGGYSYIFPYGDVPLNMVSFSGFRLQDRVSFL